MGLRAPLRLWDVLAHIESKERIPAARWCDRRRHQGSGRAQGWALMARPAFQQARIDREYRELRALDPDAFRSCVQGAEAIGINHQSLYVLSDAAKSALLADIEQHLVSAVLTALAGKAVR
jgi:hypothetical protein